MNRFDTYNAPSPMYTDYTVLKRHQPSMKLVHLQSAPGLMVGRRAGGNTDDCVGACDGATYWTRQWGSSSPKANYYGIIEGETEAEVNA